jgi:hypothetical protein
VKVVTTAPTEHDAHIKAEALYLTGRRVAVMPLRALPVEKQPRTTDPWVVVE